jgi:hypothetical protein
MGKVSGQNKIKIFFVKRNETWKTVKIADRRAKRNKT